jgi:hypothetical protein
VGSVLCDNRANALKCWPVFVRRSFFSSNRLTRLLSVPRNEINVYSVRSLVDYIRPEGQYDSSAFLRCTQLRVRMPHSSTVKIYTEESYVFLSEAK